MLKRCFQGRTYRVEVTAAGFEYRGATYPHLTPVANAITGTSSNGYQFFRLKGPWDAGQRNTLRVA